MKTIAALTLFLGCSGSPKPQAPAPAPDPHAGHHDPHAGHHGHAMPTAPPADTSRGAHLVIACEPAAQGEFDKGFFFLHNMDYVAARKVFEAAAGTHGACAMLHWGVAMTYFQPLWPGQPTKDASAKGAAAIERAKSALAKATPLERDLIAAAAAYYDQWDKLDTPTRYKNWEVGQRAVVEKHPDDVEAQAFWALARLATVDRKDKTYKETVAVATKLEELLQKKPEHPGLLHYLLHAYDNPVYASKAVGITKTYETVSPDAAHALHMPSHIHVRLGNWREVIDWNIRSAEAALQRPVEGRTSRDWLHATDYMVYGYLQQGDDAKASEAAGKIDPATKYELNSGPGAYGLAATPARMALERKLYKEAAALPVKRVDYTWEQYPWAEAATHSARGLGAARTGNAKAAKAEVAELEKLLPKIESPWWKGRVEIERDVILAWLAKKDVKKSEALMADAAKRELASGKDNVEPGHVITAAEELGDLLLEHKRYPEALAAYEAALVESPKRFNALFGAGRAAELGKDPVKARKYYEELLVVAPASTRPARTQAQQYVTKP